MPGCPQQILLLQKKRWLCDVATLADELKGSYFAVLGRYERVLAAHPITTVAVNSAVRLRGDADSTAIKRTEATIMAWLQHALPDLPDQVRAGAAWGGMVLPAAMAAAV